MTTNAPIDVHHATVEVKKQFLVALLLVRA